MPIMFPRDSTLRQLTDDSKLVRFANVSMQAQGSRINLSATEHETS